MTLDPLVLSGCHGDLLTSHCTCQKAALLHTPSTSRNHLAPPGDLWSAGYHIHSTRSPISETIRTTVSASKQKMSLVSAGPPSLSKCWESKVGCFKVFICIVLNKIICKSIFSLYLQEKCTTFLFNVIVHVRLEGTS